MAIKYTSLTPSGINANSITCVSANTLYQGLISLDPAIYTVTCASSTVAKVEFFSGISTLITTATTASGTVAINLASAADRVRIWTDTGSNIVVTITKTASALTNNVSGTLDTITTTSTYTGTSTSGYGYILLSGGGGGGCGRDTGTNEGVGGGGSSGVYTNVVALTGSMAVVIGAFGAGGSSSGTNGTAGGSSSFAGVTVTGGGGGGPARAGGTAGSGTNAEAGQTVSSNAYPGGNGGSIISPRSFINGAAYIGNGGAGTFGAGGNGTGYGSGGAGGSKNNGPATAGGNGAPGVLYVLRF